MNSQKAVYKKIDLKTEMGILKAYEDDEMSISAIAHEFCIRRRRVANILNAYNVVRRRSQGVPFKLTASMKREIKHAYVKQMKSMAEVARDTGVAGQTVKNILVELGVQIRTGSAQEMKDKKPEILKLWARGKTTRDIATKLGGTRAQVARVILRNVTVTDREITMLRSLIRAHQGKPYAEVKFLNCNVGLSGKCDVCNRTRLLRIDHSHDTGLVRGLLCNNCNVALGHLEDDVNLLRNAMEYVSRR